MKETLYMKILIAITALSLVTVSCSKNKSSSVPCNKEQVEAFVDAVKAKRDYDKMIVNDVVTEQEKTAQLNTYQEAVAKFQKTGHSCSVLVGTFNGTSSAQLNSATEKVISIASIQEYVMLTNAVYYRKMETPNGFVRPMIYVGTTPNHPSSFVIQDYLNLVNGFSAKTGLKVDLETFWGEKSSDLLTQQELAQIQALLEMIQNSEAILVLIKSNDIKGIEILNSYLSQGRISESDSIVEENRSEKLTISQKPLLI